MNTKYGFTLPEWETIKAEIHEILIDVALQRRTITYGELATQLTSATLHAGSYALSGALHEICTDEETAGRGLMCALVVRQSTGIPGDGFFKHAIQFGRDISDPTSMWQTEVNFLYEIWNTKESNT